MNCPKCGSPLNDGDKFCQTCGSAVEQNQTIVTPQPTPVVETPAVSPAPVQQPTPVVNTTEPVQQPVVNTTPETKDNKKSNNLVVVLVAIIAVLVVAIVAILFLGKNNNGGGNSSGGNEPTPTAVVAPQYSEVTVGQYKFKLLPGYQVENTTNGVILYNSTDTVEALMANGEGQMANLDVNEFLLYLKSNGFDATSKELNVEGKKGYSFVGKYNNYDYEVVYIQESANKIVGADIVYLSSEAMAAESDNFHKMIALTTLVEPTSQNKTSSFANLQMPSFK